MSKKNSEQQNNYHQNREQVLLALAIQEKKDPGSHLTNEQIAELVDGRIPEENRELLWQHINACDSCYSHWLNVCRSKNASSVSPYEKVKHLFVPLVAAACIVLAILWMLPSNIEQLLTESYELAEHVKNFQLPWEKTTPFLGIVDSNSFTYPKRAFASGLLDGRKLLLKDQVVIPKILLPDPDKNDLDSITWTDSKWKPYFLSGQWCFMLKVACLSDTTYSATFWEKNNHIIKQLKSLFQQQNNPDSTINRLLDNVQKKLGNPSETAKELGYLIQYLSPDYLPESG